MTRGRFEQRALDEIAAHHHRRDEYAKAYRVVARFPIYTIRGGSRHHILNGDMFEAEKHTTAGGHPKDQVAEQDARSARQHQAAEERAELERIADEAMGGEA